MANFFSGLFRSNDKLLTTHPPSTLPEFSQYESEYITYCIEQEQTISNLEAQLHADDDPAVIAKRTLKTTCDFYGMTKH